MKTKKESKVGFTMLYLVGTLFLAVELFMVLAAMLVSTIY